MLCGQTHALTGGDTISVRFLHGEWFGYKPAYKLWIATNHRPIIRGTDHAIWECIHLIPFTITIPPGKRDKHLTEKLMAEAPGILRWIVEGAAEWHESGLKPPSQVVGATETYREEMDTLGSFLVERCLTTSNAASVTKSALYAEYRDWCQAAGEPEVTAKRLGMQLMERGFEDRRDAKSQRIWRGIGLLHGDPSKPDGLDT